MPDPGGAIALASQGKNHGWAMFIMYSFSLGVASLILKLGYGTGNILRRHRTSVKMISRVAQPALGAAFFIGWNSASVQPAPQYENLGAGRIARMAFGPLRINLTNRNLI